MTLSSVLLLGAFSGLTIFIGMPLARVRILSKEYLCFLNALAIGVLFFLFADVLCEVLETIEPVLHKGDLHVLSYIGVFTFGFSSGFLLLVSYGQKAFHRGGAITSAHIAFLIALGIGLHNFTEGLAIGSSAASGAITLAWLLILGFGLHNITEAFGIASPLAGTSPSYKFLFFLGCVAGAPNIVGALIGYYFFSPLLSIFFLALAAGTLLYVIGELLASGRKFEAHAWMGWGLIIGFLIAMFGDFFFVWFGL